MRAVRVYVAAPGYAGLAEYRVGSRHPRGFRSPLSLLSLLGPKTPGAKVKNGPTPDGHWAAAVAGPGMVSIAQSAVTPPPPTPGHAGTCY